MFDCYLMSKNNHVSQIYAADNIRETHRQIGHVRVPRLYVFSVPMCFITKLAIVALARWTLVFNCYAVLVKLNP